MNYPRAGQHEHILANFGREGERVIARMQARYSAGRRPENMAALAQQPIAKQTGLHLTLQRPPTAGMRKCITCYQQRFKPPLRQHAP